MRRILLIDDNETDLYIGKRLFTHFNGHLIVETSLNGQEALDYLDKCRSENTPHPDLIICDIVMPVMDGYQFVREYEKSFREYSNKCCILICSSTLDRSEMAIFKNHALVRDFIQKPLQPEQIFEYMQEHQRK